MFRRHVDRSSQSPSAHGRAQRAWHGLAKTVLHPLESGLVKLLLVLLLLVGLYALLGFVVAPRVLRAQLVELVRERYGRRLAVGEVRVHPFMLWVELRDLALPDVDGKRLLRVGRFFVDFQGLASVWERAYVFGEIALQQPEIRLVVRPGGAINLADLAPATPPAKAAKPERAKHERDTLPRLWIQSLVVDGGKLLFVDRDRPKSYERTLGPVAFSVRDFRTTAAGGMFGLSASTGDGAQLDWKGKVALTPQLASSGSPSISRFPLPSLAEYLADALPCDVPRGVVDLAGSYAVSSKASLKLDLRLSRVAVRELTLRARDHSSSLARGAARFDRASVGIARMELSDVRVALHRRQAEVARMVVHRLDTRAVLEPDGTLSYAWARSSSRTKAGRATRCSRSPRTRSTFR